MIALGIGLMMCVVASAIFYLGCPNQQWLPSRFYKAKTGALLSGLFALASTWTHPTEESLTDGTRTSGPRGVSI